MLTIKDVLQAKSSAIYSISPKDSAYKAMKIMAEKNIGILVVIDEERVVGVISERDLARKVLLKALPPKKIRAGSLMTKDIYCITPDKSVEECLGVMTTARIRHLPVFKNKRLIGVVTFGDIAKALLLEQKIKIQNLESYQACSNSVSFED